MKTVTINEPFCSIEIEKHVIGALFCETDLAQVLCNILRPSDFYLDLHSAIWDLITAFAMEAKPFTIFDLSARAKNSKHSKLEESIMGILREIYAEVVSSANAERHAKIILGYSQRRRTRDLHRKIGIALEDPEKDLETILLNMETGAVGIRGSLESSSGLRVVPTDEWIREALDAYDQTVYRGESTGWKSLDEIFMVGSGQVTVVTGIPNHGKSEFLDAMMLNLAVGSGWRIAYWSPENNPLRRHVQKLAEKTVGKYLYGNSRMTLTEYHKALHETIAKHFRFLGQGFSGATFDQVLLEFGKMNPRPQACIIDPWNRLEIPSDSASSETDYIRQCLSRATRFTQTTGIHLFVVAHPQKLQKNKDGGRDKPGLYDISGSAHWANIVDNGMLVYRNFKEKKSEVHMLKVRFKDNGHPGMREFGYETSSGRYYSWTAADDFSSGTDAPTASKSKSKTKPNPQAALPLNDQPAKIVEEEGPLF